MDKLSVLCITQLIERFSVDDSLALFDLVNDVSEWLTKSVSTVAELRSFDDVQRELISVAQYIASGKSLTRRSVNKLFCTLKCMQHEMLDMVGIVLFVMPTIKMKFNDNIKVIVVNDVNDCIDKAYDIQDKLKYLLYMNDEEVDSELENAVDIAFSFEELMKVANDVYPIDMFAYDRLYLTAKLSKITSEQSEVLIAGSSYSMCGLLEERMPCKATNVGVNAQDLYYTLLSVKEVLSRSHKLCTIIIPLAYYFFFSDMNDKPSDYLLSVLSKVDYPVFNKLNGYKGELKPVYSKANDYPIYEAIVDLAAVRDIYHNALMKELMNLSYFNNINKRSKCGMLSYDFREKTDEQNFSAAKLRAEGHNSNFDLDRGVANQRLLNSFLDDMEELGMKIIFFVPPTTKFYKAGISKDMINAYTQLVMPVVEAHKCCTFIDLYNSDLFFEEDFQDYDHLNEKGAVKLSDIIASHIERSGSGE